MRTQPDVGIATLKLNGPSSPVRVSDTGSTSVAAAPRWSGRGFTIDDVTAGEWAAKSCSGVVRLGGGGPDVLILARVTEGSGLYSITGQNHAAPNGSLHLVSLTEPLEFTVTGTCRVIYAAIGRSTAHNAIPGARHHKPGPISDGRIGAALTSVLEEVLDPSRGGPSCPAAGALRAVLIAAIDDAAPAPLALSPRDRVAEYIRQHLSDPHLGPVRVAAAFGVSLRRIHDIFNIDGVTLAQHIRAQRLELVAAHVRSNPRSQRIPELAQQAGFRNGAQLTRGFKAKYGITIPEYAGNTHAAPTPPDSTISRQEPHD